MIYSIIFNRYDKESGLVSWMDTNEFETEEKANEHAVRMCHNWWDTDPTISFMIFKHAMIWKTQSRYKYDEE